MYVNFNILNQLGSPSINSNTFANRPAAGQTGRLFVSTDTFEIYRDNGTGWDLIGGPGSSTVTGTGASGQVTYWTGASTIAGNNDLFWDIANSRLGIGTTTPGHKLQINGTGTLLSLNGGSDTYMLFAGNGADQYQIGYTDNAADYRRFSIYDSTGAKEVLTIDKQSRYVGINYQYSSLADQPAYTLDVSGSTRATDSSFFVTSGTGQVGINTTSPTQATALIEAVKTDGYGLFLNYATSSGSGSTATALWALNTTAGSGYGAVIEEKTANTTGGQYPLLIKHSLSTGTAAAGMGTGLHFQLPDSTGTFKTTQLTVETTDAAAATYTTRYRFMAQVNGTSTALAYLTSVGLGIGNVIPSYKLDVNGTVRAFGVGNTGNFLAVDTNPGGATVQLNPQYGTGLPILQSVGSFPLLFGTNNTEVARFFTNGNFLIGTSGIDNGNKLQVSGNTYISGNLSINTTLSAWGSYSVLQFPAGSLASFSTTYLELLQNAFWNGSYKYVNNGFATEYVQEGGQHRWFNAPSGTAGNTITFTQAMTLDASGRLGIGTSTPVGALQVSTFGYYSYFSGNANGTSPNDVQGLSFGWNKSAGNGESLIVYNKGAGSSGGLVFANNDGGSYAERARFTSGGNFLIGTTTDAGYKLSVNGSLLSTYGYFSGTGGGAFNSQITVNNTTSSPALITFQNTANGHAFGFTSTGTQRFTFINGSLSECASIDSSGNQILTGSIKTDAPNTGTAAAWKLGSYKAAAVVVSTTNYIEVDIGGTLYKLAVVT